MNLRYTVPERRAAFVAGLNRLGYEVVESLTNDPSPGDILVTWNRIGQAHHSAKVFEDRGLAVLVAENASWGNEFAGDRWYSLARNYHNTAGMFPVGGHERWDGLGVELEQWRSEGTTLILPQRGIGPKPVAMPSGWAQDAHQRFGGRVRHHPGRSDCRPLEDDLGGVGKVVTWGSGAAVKCLLRGIPVISEMPNWCAAQDNTDAGRLEMFRRLAWLQWRLDEIRYGEAFRRFLV